MGHYWSEMRGDPTELELKQEKAAHLVIKLRKHKTSKFTVNELALLIRTSCKENYYSNECDEIFKMASKLGISS